MRSAETSSACRACVRGALHDQRAEARHRRRAVDQREAFLEAQLKRLDAQLAQDGGGLHPLAVAQDVALADERARDVRERDEVTAGAERADLRDGRDDVLVQVEGQALQDLRTHRGVTLGEGVETGGHDGPRLVLGEQGTHAGAVAAHEVGLQPDLVRLVHLHVDHLTVAGGDAVDRDVLLRQLLQHRPAAQGLGDGLGGDTRRCAFLGDAPDRVDGEGLAVEGDGDGAGLN
ncbi:hypothetical protein GCM10020254_86110 [Streptomyces goshikiensis]